MVSFPLSSWNELCKMYIRLYHNFAPKLSHGLPLHSKYNPWAVRPSTLWPVYHFTLYSYHSPCCSLYSCQTSFLAFPPTYQTGSQWAWSWLMVFAFTMPSTWSKFLQNIPVRSSFCFPQNSLLWLTYLKSATPITLSLLTLQGNFSMHLSLIHITDLFISCLH